LQSEGVNNIIDAGGVSFLISSTPEAGKAIFDCAGISAAQPRLRFARVMLPKHSDEKLTGLETRDLCRDS
jgi:hypothetical protein